MRRWCALILCACEGTSAQTTLFVTSALDDGDPVSIAVITDGQRIAAYACAADVSNDPYPGWFVGEIAPDGRFSLPLGGWLLDGTVSGARASGAIHEPDGTVVAWSSAPAPQSGLTGLYTDASDPSARTTTVIVLDEDPSQPPIVRGAYRDVMQVTPVVPVALVDDRLAVDVPMLAASLPVWVSPVRTVPTR